MTATLSEQEQRLVALLRERDAARAVRLALWRTEVRPLHDELRRSGGRCCGLIQPVPVYDDEYRQKTQAKYPYMEFSSEIVLGRIWMRASEGPPVHATLAQRLFEAMEKYNAAKAESIRLETALIDELELDMQITPNDGEYWLYDDYGDTG